ncbi:MAG: helix-turn-helix transcriptional regulator [Cyclobacteriaceae bacterium]
MAKRKGIPKNLNLIKEVLESRDLTQSWLAGQLDIEFRTINRYANNVRQPSLETLFRIAEILKVNVKDLINS